MTDRWTSQLILLSTLLIIVLVYMLAPILTPFLVGAFLAYLTNPLVHRLTRWGVPHLLATILVFISLLLILTLLIFLLVPIIEDQLISFIQFIPTIIDVIHTNLTNTLEYFNINVEEINPDTIKNALKNNLSDANSIATWIGQKVFHSGLAIVGIITNIVLIPVVTFYLLRDWDIVLTNIKKLLPRSIEPTVTSLANECNQVLSEFIRGQLLVMLCLGIIYSVGLSLVGLKIGIIIGLISGLASIVPYLGFVIGILSASIAAWVQFGSWTSVMLVILVYLIGQTIDGMFLTPNLVGKRIGLHPVAVIFAVLAGGVLFGFLGVLLALPVASVLMVLLRYFTKKYEKSEFYQKRI